MKIIEYLREMSLARTVANCLRENQYQVCLRFFFTEYQPTSRCFLGRDSFALQPVAVRRGPRSSCIRCRSQMLLVRFKRGKMIAKGAVFTPENVIIPFPSRHRSHLENSTQCYLIKGVCLAIRDRSCQPHAPCGLRTSLIPAGVKSFTKPGGSLEGNEDITANVLFLLPLGGTSESLAVL